MYRNLHITIHEAGRAGRRPARFAAAAGAAFDPEGPERVIPDPNDPDGPERVIPDPNDPEGPERVLPDPNDPEDPERVIPDPNDPTGGYWLQGATGSRAAGPAAAVWESAYGGVPPVVCCCPCEDKDKIPQRPGAGPGDYSGFVIVRLAAGVGPLTVRSLWELARKPGFAALKAVLELPGKPPADGASDTQTGAPPPPADPKDGPAPKAPAWREPSRVLVSRPLVELTPGGYEGGQRPTRGQTVDAILKLESHAKTTRYAPLHSLASYFRVDLRDYPELLAEAVERFAALPEVDLAYRELTASDPGTRAGRRLAEDQGYLDPAPVGIGAAGVWETLDAWSAKKGAGPGGLTVCDLEQGWHLDHKELVQKVELPLFYGENREVDEPGQGHHGTAVLGQLAAAGSGTWAVQGIARDAGRFTLSSHYRSVNEDELDDQGNAYVHPFGGTRGHVAAAIANALIDRGDGGPDPLSPGDVLLLEVQRGRLPTEIDAADFDAIRLATALQVVVVEAAGNGGIDLDRYVDPDTGRSLSRRAASFRDSGAIFGGAARAALPHDRAPFSNFGTRLDCFAWGESVTSCGYGDLGGAGTTDYYTNTFSGTSSASPIIAGAAALVQRLRRVCGVDPLRPAAMRALLSDPATGTRQGPNVAGFIGVMPDLGAILRGRLQLVPDVYMRASVGDDGTRPVPAGDPISSSPDVIPRRKDLGAASRARLTDELAGGNGPAPGGIVGSKQEGRVYVRLRNRGGVDGRVRVALFASPAATLITPEWWTRLSTVGPVDVPRGDGFVLAEPPAVWTPAGFDPGTGAPEGVRCYSYLAVQRPADGSAEPWLVDRSEGLPPGPPWFDWAEYRAFLRGPGVAWRNVHRVRPAAQGATDLAFLFAGTPDRARGFDFEVLQRLPEGTALTLHAPGAFAAKLRQRQPAVGAGAEVEAWDAFPVQPSPVTPLGRVELAAGARIWAVLSLAAGGQPLGRGHSVAIRQLWRGEEVGRITWWFFRPAGQGQAEDEDE